MPVKDPIKRRKVLEKTYNCFPKGLESPGCCYWWDKGGNMSVWKWAPNGPLVQVPDGTWLNTDQRRCVTDKGNQRSRRKTRTSATLSTLIWTGLGTNTRLHVWTSSCCVRVKQKPNKTYKPMCYCANHVKQLWLNDTNWRLRIFLGFSIALTSLTDIRDAIQQTADVAV
jgi:hypothetical protein